MKVRLILTPFGYWSILCSFKPLKAFCCNNYFFRGFGWGNYSREETIQGRKVLIIRRFLLRKLFKGGKYSREETICGNTVCAGTFAWGVKAKHCYALSTNCLLPQVKFPANNLNFHWKSRLFKIFSTLD